MAEINNNVNVTAGLIRDSQNRMGELRDRLGSKAADSKEAHKQEMRQEMLDMRDRKADARAAVAMLGVDSANNVSELFSYMNNSGNGSGAPGMWGGGTFDNSVFFQSGGELANLQAMNSARIGIESRAKALVGEIGRDRARGLDVSDRQEALLNLTGNLDILNRNLSNSIDRALSDSGGKREGNFVDVVGRIKESLAPKPATATNTPEEAEGAEDVPSVPVAPTQPPAQPQAESVENPAVAAQESDPTPAFAPPAAFEGSASEQIVAASEAPEPDEMSVAAQIASDSKAEHAESVDIMSERSENEEEALPKSGIEATVEQAAEIPEHAVEMGVTPANV